MQIELTNFKYKGRPVNYIATSVSRQINETLLSNDISCRLTTRNDTVTFLPVKDGKLFISAKKNKIVLKPSDPRVTKIGRDYLSSERLTEEQYNVMVDSLTLFFDKSGIECDIKYYEFKDDNKSFSYWRQGNVKGNIFKPNSFPQKV